VNDIIQLLILDKAKICNRILHFIYHGFWPSRDGFKASGPGWARPGRI